MPPRVIFIGTEYLYPVDYEVIPIVKRSANGAYIQSAIVVPVKFERRFAGTGLYSE